MYDQRSLLANCGRDARACFPSFFALLVTGGERVDLVSVTTSATEVSSQTQLFSIAGSIHQSDERFGDIFKGRQCSFISFFSPAAFKVMFSSVLGHFVQC